jgi:glycine/D-amino acid oxidase-like deaminating enzyme
MSISSQSLWITDSKNTYPKLSQERSCDVAIVGGGIVGVTTAYLLSKVGKKVVLLEKNTIGSGATGYTTAMITQYIDIEMSKLVELFGKGVAKKIWQSGKDAIDCIERNIREEKIDCNFIRLPYIVYAKDEKEREELQEEQKAAKTIGVELTFANNGSLVLKNQAKFHPIKYLRGLANSACQNGAQIFEKSEVVDFDQKSLIVHTKDRSVSAQSIVVATHTPFDGPKTLTMKKGTYTTYIIVLEVKKDSISEDAMYQDMHNPYHYFRIDKKDTYDLVILGGEDHRSQIPVSAEKSFKALEEYFTKLFPNVNYKIRAQWSGPIIETADGLPYIGSIEEDSSVYYATGFSGNGMTFGTLAGMIILDEICGKENPYAEIYKASRIPSPSQLWNKIGDYTEEFFEGAVKNI